MTQTKERNQQIIQSVFVDQSQLLSDAMSGAQNLTPEKLKSTFMQVALRQPKIWQCTGQSILETVLLAARLDVDPSGHHNGAHFVPFWNKDVGANELKLMLGYNAMVDLATRDGRITSFTTGVIYQDEDHKIRLGTDRAIEHTPTTAERRTDERPIWYYAIAWFPSGQFEFEAMSDAQIESVRVRSQQKDGPPWKFARAEMGKKSVLRRLIKRLPLNPVLGRAIEHTDLADGFEFGTRRRVQNTTEGTAEKLLGPADEVPGREADASGVNERSEDRGPTDEELAAQGKFDPDEIDIPF